MVPMPQTKQAASPITSIFIAPHTNDHGGLPMTLQLSYYRVKEIKFRDQL